MKIIPTKVVYEAFDEKIFTSKSECEKYEAQKETFLSNFKFFTVYYFPDLAETGLFTKRLLVAVYATKDGGHEEVVSNYCIKKFGYLGKSVQGYGFQRYFSIHAINFETYSHGTIEDWRGDKCHPRKILLSPTKFDEFKDIERFDYMKE
jgi:hypothetical protein